MRHDDDLAEKCGAWGAGLLVAASLVLMLLAVGFVGWLATREDIRL